MFEYSFRRLEVGWALTTNSFQALRTHSSLAVFPVMAVATVVAYIVALLVGVHFLAIEGDELHPAVAGTAAFVLFYLGAVYLNNLFTAALMYASRQAFEGEGFSTGGGLWAALSNFFTLLVWSMAAATAGVVIRADRHRLKGESGLEKKVFGVPWPVMTYFLLPAIVFEGAGLRSVFGRSKELFEDGWEGATDATFRVGTVTSLIVGIVLFFAVVATVLIWSTVHPVPAVGFFLATAFLAYHVGSVLGGLAKVSLYLYATEGEQPREFRNLDFATIAGEEEHTRETETPVPP